MPKNPIITADQRQIPTLAPRIGIDKAVKKRGPAKTNVEAVANSNFIRAKKKQNWAAAMLAPLKNSSKVFFFPVKEKIGVLFFVIIKIINTGTKPKILRATARRVGL